MHDLRTIYPARVDGPPVVVKLLFPSADLPQAPTFINSNGSGGRYITQAWGCRLIDLQNGAISGGN